MWVEPNCPELFKTGDLSIPRRHAITQYRAVTRVSRIYTMMALALELHNLPPDPRIEYLIGKRGLAVTAQ